MSRAQRPVSLTIAALGGQGGGVVAGWLTRVARVEGWLAQATSVPGVAQRTGATIYYLEFFPEAGLPADGRRPVMALMPSPGDVDIVVASEWVEAGRAIQRGFVTPDRTVLIASTHRAYTIAEKSHLGDGRADSGVILAEARRAARQLVAFDMAEVAGRHGAIVSSVILGAIAGAAGLPFSAESYRQAIREGGIAVDTNLAAFEAACARARAGGDPAVEPASPTPAARQQNALPHGLAGRIEHEFPAGARATLRHGVTRLADYQDDAYASEYLDRVATVVALDGDPSGRLTEATARGLALWMSLEDTIRVAEIKTRPGRLAELRRRSGARAGQLVEITEFLKPRVEEICGTLPAGLGRRLRDSGAWRRRLERFTGGRELRTTTVSGYLLLRGVAALKRWRRGTLRHVEENARIGRWLEAVSNLAAADYGLAVELAECQHLVRGYGDTYERGLASFEAITAAAGRMSGTSSAAEAVARLRRAATADDRGDALKRELSALGVG